MMISCTEFIPAYSELFTWLENQKGRPEVERFWAYLFAPTGKGIPLINFAKKEGLRGCWKYWEGTLKEEAADCVRYMNEEQGWIASRMHYCPSKGRLLELEKEIGLIPYYDYCGHCDYYRSHLEAVGLVWIRDHIDVDKASCRSFIFDPKKFKGMIVKDENTEVLEVNSKDAEYFHPDFHSSMNMGIEYVGENYGREGVESYLTLYTEHVYCRELKAIQTEGLAAIEAQIQNTYKLEKAESLLKTELTEKGLKVTVAHCPAVKHLHKTGRQVSRWYRCTTEDVMKRFAKEAGAEFVMDSYDEETGAAAYHFTK